MHTLIACRRGFHNTAALVIYRKQRALRFLVKSQFLKAFAFVFDTARKYIHTVTHTHVNITRV